MAWRILSSRAGKAVAATVLGKRRAPLPSIQPGTARAACMTMKPTQTAAMPAKPSPPSADARRDTPGAGRTQTDTEGDGAAPRLPHERDESADSQQPAQVDPLQADIGERGRRDVERGVEDTDRGPVADRTYDRLKRGGR